MRFCGVLIIIPFLMLSAAPTEAASPGTNQPAGWAAVMDWPADSLADSGFRDTYNSCPVQNGMAVATWKAGAAAGGCQLDSTLFDQTPLKEFYFAIRWKHDYCCASNLVDKIFYFYSNDEGWVANQAIILYDKRLSMDMQDPLTNNCHIPGAWGDSYCSILPSSAPPLKPDEWHVIELKIKTSTSKTSRDGAVEEWHNGVKVMDYKNVNIHPGGVYSFSFTQTWTAGPLFPPPTYDWHQYLDHVYISVPGSGGSLPDTTPPGPPKGLRSI